MAEKVRGRTKNKVNNPEGALCSAPSSSPILLSEAGVPLEPHVLNRLMRRSATDT